MSYERALVFVAHPDDEGTMGGAIVKMREAGTEVTLVQMCTGSGGYPKPEWKDKIVEMRTAEGDACGKVLGIKPRTRVGRPDGELIFDRQTSEECIRLIREHKPNAIFTHGEADLHPDHRNLCEMVKFAFRMAGRPVRSCRWWSRRAESRTSTCK
jgi:LmbE family N-acetylglucosaminyl deacetylase